MSSFEAANQKRHSTANNIFASSKVNKEAFKVSSKIVNPILTLHHSRMTTFRQKQKHIVHGFRPSNHYGKNNSQTPPKYIDTF